MKPISFSLNGVQRNITVDDTRMLLWVLRDDLGLTQHVSDSPTERVT